MIPQDVERPPASVIPEHVAPGFGPEMHVNTPLISMVIAGDPWPSDGLSRSNANV